MDGVSAAASIVSLIQAANAIYKYGVVTFNAKAEQKRLSIAIEDLKVKLTLLKEQDERAAADPDAPWYRGVRAILKSSKQFADDGTVQADPGEKGEGALRRLQTAMQNREDKLSRRQIGCTALPRRLLWYWEKKKFEETVAEVHQWIAVVDSIRSYDHFTLDLDTNAQVKLTHDDVKVIDDKMEVLQNEFGKAAKEKEKRVAEKRRIAIVDWLSPLKFKERQSALLIQMSTSLSLPSLLMTEEYTRWEDGHPYILHCEAKPGAGKTLMCASVIKHLQGVFKDRDAQILCIYLNHKEQGDQSLDNLISSLLKQIIQREGVEFRSARAKSLYQGAGNGGRPTLEEFYHALVEELDSYERTFVVVDGLDEATPRIAPRLIQRLQMLSEGGTSILMTSQRTENERRLTLQDQCDICKRSPLTSYYECRICHGGRFYICNKCREEEHKYCENKDHELFERRKVVVSVEPSQDDIRHYVKAELDEELDLGASEEGNGYASMFETTPLGRIMKRSPSLENEIIDVVAAKSDGMYALAGLYMKSFRSLGLSEAQILDMLDQPPEHYSFFYEQHMQRIISGFGGSDHRAADLGRKILSWVACTKRPLSLSELQDALAVDIDKPGVVSPLDRYDKATIVRSTAGLVTVDNPSEFVRLNHQSAQQYFDDNREMWFPNIDSEITRTSLQYLSSDQLYRPCEGEYEDKDFEERKRDHPFLVYAYQYWGDHAAGVGSDPVASDAVIKFLSNPDTVASSTQANWYLMTDSAADWDVRKGTNGLHISAWFGLSYAVMSLLDQGLSIDFRDPRGQTPLMYACRRAQSAAVSDFLSRGANVNETSSRGGSSIFEALTLDRIEVLNLLLSNPATDINQPHGLRSNSTALMIAIQEHHLQQATALIGHPRIDIMQQDVNGNTALSHAVMSKDQRTVGIILDKFGQEHRLLNSTNWKGNSALILAANDGQDAIVNLLLNRGADTSIKDSEGNGTALLRAVDSGHLPTVKLLLKYADVACRDDKERGLLHGAAVGGHDEIVALLLRKGLDASPVDLSGSTPLHDASRAGAWAITQLLLNASAIPDLKDKANRTPWTVAWQYGHLSVMRVLEGKAHDERTESEGKGQYPNASSLPVWSLALHGEKDLVAEATRDRPQEITHQNPDNENTALHSAILSEQPEVQQMEILHMLLQAGMAADARNEYYRTPLHLAAQYGSIKFMRLLLDEGNATVDVKDKWGTTPLLMTYADENKYIECALVLVEAGATIPTTKHLMKQSLFFAAIESGNLAALINLVQTGADVQAKNVLGYTGLQLAKDGGKSDIECYLRSNKSMKVPEVGHDSLLEDGEDGEDVVEEIQALSLAESPFHRPAAWVEEYAHETGQSETRTAHDAEKSARDQTLVSDNMELQSLKRIAPPTKITQSEKQRFEVKTKTVRIAQPAC